MNIDYFQRKSVIKIDQTVQDRSQIQDMIGKRKEITLLKVLL